MEPFRQQAIHVPLGGLGTDLGRLSRAVVAKYSSSSNVGVGVQVLYMCPVSTQPRRHTIRRASAKTPSLLRLPASSCQKLV
ncbi:hypothetical protein CFAM422_007622 [Trichoderma lentiforme]|uniref:Uncharacterized protein n=1 Tax=Trichoderma lentiforme TaxID=1567552 RepID=A0A9P4XCU8_9HYPO|nr:hypothetical protein CFAM422_007622 [Trichoderma lentiforme]